MRTRFRHVLDRHGLWDEVRETPPPDEFGPLVNLGLLWMLGFPNALEAMESDPLVRSFVRRATRDELATFIAFLAALGSAEVMEAKKSRYTDRDVADALHATGSKWGWLAMPASMRRDYRRAFEYIETRRESTQLSERSPNEGQTK